MTWSISCETRYRVLQSQLISETMGEDMKIITLTAPSHWASYLINGDATGLDDCDINDCDRWLRSEFGRGGFSCVDAIDAGFMRWHDAGHYALAADCSEFTFII